MTDISFQWPGQGLSIQIICEPQICVTSVEFVIHSWTNLVKPHESLRLLPVSHVDGLD